jgi:hypothetical protein
LFLQVTAEDTMTAVVVAVAVMAAEEAVVVAMVAVAMVAVSSL